jgi:hypothetical protein
VGLAYVIADLALSGGIATLEVIAELPLADVAAQLLSFEGSPLTCHPRPRLLLGTRRDWNRTEQFAAVPAGIADG